jgi:NADH dehydrogenase
MSPTQLDAVTGAFGYSGKYITRRLLEMGHGVRTLTNSTHRPNPFGNKVEAFPYNFDETDKVFGTHSGRGR